MIKVSVIIPVYNVEKYLKECLDSVVNQTLKDIEIILVDDGSTDSSFSICKEYEQNDSRIKVLTQKNQGAGIARNFAIDEANGEFVMFLDSDDYYPANDILEVLYNKAKENNVLVVGGSFSQIADGVVSSSYKKSFSGYTFEEEKLVKYEDYQFDYGFHRFIYNTNLLKENNIYFPNYLRFQDPPFHVKALYYAKEFYSIPKITYLLRIEHKLVNWTDSKKKDLLDGIEENLNFAKQHNLEKLYYLTCERLNQHIEAFDYVLPERFKNIDFEIVKKYNKDFKFKKKSKWRDLKRFVFSVSKTSDYKLVKFLGISFKIKTQGGENA